MGYYMQLRQVTVFAACDGSCYFAGLRKAVISRRIAAAAEGGVFFTRIYNEFNINCSHKSV